MNQLVGFLEESAPRYIRCIKPNSYKAKHIMSSKDTTRQLRCAGLLEAIRIRKAGYAIRRRHKEFFNTYKLIVENKSDYECIKDSMSLKLAQRIFDKNYKGTPGKKDIELLFNVVTKLFDTKFKNPSVH
jgi:myosin heavy subunit